jgi:RNA polymerase sigma-70 factor (ECF subfamily)
MIETNETLLDRVRRADAHDAWREFYAAYRGAVVGYACRLGLRGAAVDEVLQDTFVTLVRVLPDFRYDRERGRFRNFLFRIVHHRSHAAIKRQRTGERRDISPDAAGIAELLRDDAPARMDHEEWTRAREAWRAALAAEAYARVRAHPAMKPRTIAIFDDFVIHGQSAEEVALKHGTPVGNVHQIRHRTLQRIQRELAQLLAAAGEEPA